MINPSPPPPDVLCRALTGGATELTGVLIGAKLGGPLGAIVGEVLGAMAQPFAEYYFCAENTGEAREPFQDFNNFPLVLETGLSRTVYVPLPESPEQPRLYQPPVTLEEKLGTSVYQEEDRGRTPGTTKFPLSQAISAREKLKDRKIGCALHRPWTDEAITLTRCKASINKSALKDEKEQFANYIAGEGYSRLPAFGILTKREGNTFSTESVVGLSLLTASAVEYAARNEDLYSRPITKIPKEIKYENQDCIVSMNDILLNIKLKLEAEDAQEPFIELRTAFLAESN